MVVLLVVGFCRTNGRLVECVLGVATGSSRRLLNHSNVDNHVVAEVLVASNECVSMVVLKTDAF
jgi:hypothetical protein